MANRTLSVAKESEAVWLRAQQIKPRHQSMSSVVAEALALYIAKREAQFPNGGLD